MQESVLLIQIAAVLADHVCYVIFFCAYTYIKINATFLGNTLQILDEFWKSFQSNVCVLQNAVDENAFDVVIGAVHSINESNIIVCIFDCRKVIHADGADIEIYTGSVAVRLFDEYDAAAAFFSPPHWLFQS